jgi:transposase, IS5 family
MNEVFSFVDASHLIAKASLWKERDQAVKNKERRLTHKILPKVAYDEQVRIGCKEKDKFWVGYKHHVSVVDIGKSD